MTLDQFKKLEGMFKDGFLMVFANPDGRLQYAKWNPRRIETLEMWEKYIVDTAAQHGPSFWKGFISKDEIPDYFPKEWENGEHTS